MERSKTQNSESSQTRALPTARVAALKLLAARRLTESQLWQRLVRRGYEDETIAETVMRCRRDGLLDDRLFASLYVEGKTKALGDARLVAELVKRGIDRDAARASVRDADRGEEQRLSAAIDKLFRTRPSVSYPSAARALERLGFPTAAIYRALRARSVECAPFGDLSDLHERVD